MLKITHRNKSIDLSYFNEIQNIQKEDLDILNIGNNPTWVNPFTKKVEPIVSCVGSTVTAIDPRIKKSPIFYFPSTSTPHINCYRCGNTQTNVVINSSKDTMIIIRRCCGEHIVFSPMVLNRTLNKISTVFYKAFGMFHKYIVSEANRYGRNVEIRYNDLSLMLRTYINSAGRMNGKYDYEKEFISVLRSCGGSTTHNYLAATLQRIGDYVYDGKQRLSFSSERADKIRCSEYNNIYMAVDGMKQFLMSVPIMEKIGLQTMWFGNIL